MTFVLGSWGDLKVSLLELPLLGKFETLIPFVIFPLIFGLALFFAWLSKRAREKRKQDIQTIAGELGLEFLQVRPGEFDGRITKYKLIHYGRNRQSSNFVTAKTDELSLVIFDHEYTSGQGKSKKVHRQSVAWVISQQLKLPTFVLSPESWFDRLSNLFTKKDIDIAQDPEFSKAFVLLGESEDSIREFFNSDRREALLKIKMPTIEAFTGEFMFYRPGKRVAPAELKDLMSEAFSLYQAFVDKKVERVD